LVSTLLHIQQLLLLLVIEVYDGKRLYLLSPDSVTTHFDLPHRHRHHRCPNPCPG